MNTLIIGVLIGCELAINFATLCVLSAIWGELKDNGD